MLPYIFFAMVLVFGTIQCKEMPSNTLFLLHLCDLLSVHAIHTLINKSFFIFNVIIKSVRILQWLALHTQVSLCDYLSILYSIVIRVK